jgi:hypothetical protein
MLPTYISIREVKIYCDLIIYGSSKRILTLKSSFLSIEFDLIRTTDCRGFLEKKFFVFPKNIDK